MRLSGPQADEFAQAIVGELPQPRFATHRRFRDTSGETIDNGIVLYFPAPNSFTGETVVEPPEHQSVV